MAGGQASTMDNSLHVACGERHALAIRSDGTLWAIGDGAYGQTGRGNSPQYWQQVPIAFTPVTIAAGAFHSLAIDANQHLWATGDDQFGEIGANGGAVSAFAQVLPGNAVTAIAGGYRHSIAALASGGWAATGDNSSGQLGLGDYSSRSSWTIGIGPIMSRVAARDNQSFYISNQQLFAAGDNRYGQLGVTGAGARTASWQAAQTPAWMVAAGISHTLLINAGNREVWAVGDNSHGQFGALNPSATNNPPWVRTSR